MQAQLMHDEHKRRAYLLVFSTGDDVLRKMLAWADEQRVSSAAFTAIGAFQSVTLGYFDVERREYLPVAIDEQVEVLSLAGNVALADEGRRVHAHVVIGKRDGTAHGGHLINAVVRPTLELMLTENAQPLRRRLDAATGLPLLDVGEGGR